MKLDDITPEKVWQTEVVATAHAYGWLVYHPLPSMNRRGRWGTHQIGDTGFPDLMMAHHRHGVLFVELKTNAGRLSVAQQRWLDTLHSGGAETHVWRPRDRAEMKLRLMGDRHAV
jgi:hypothetical protein